MLRVGDSVRWMCPMDPDYMYGEIVNIYRGMATVKGNGIYSRVTSWVPLKFIEKLAGGRNDGSGAGNNKLSSTESEL